MNTWARPDRFLSFTLARVPIGEFDSLVADILAGFRTEPMRRRGAPLALDSIYDVAPLPGGVQPKRMVLFAPKSTANCTVMVTNSIDGQSSLSHVAAGRHRQFQIQVISTEIQAKFPQNRFTSWNYGEETRSVICMLDTRGWLFYERGKPQPFENVENYRRRRRRDRLTRDILTSYLSSIGIDFTSSDFWTSSQEAVYYLPYH